MEQPTAMQIKLLSHRIKYLEKWLTLFCVWVADHRIVLFLWTNRSETSGNEGDTLRVHKLVILDQENRERIVLAAPIPDPKVNGKTLRRKEVVAVGIQFKD